MIFLKETGLEKGHQGVVAGGGGGGGMVGEPWSVLLGET